MDGALLTQPTEAELRHRAAEIEAANKRKLEAEEKARRKAQADAEAAAFQLTGSDRPADATPQQEALF